MSTRGFNSTTSKEANRIHAEKNHDRLKSSFDKKDSMIHMHYEDYKRKYIEVSKEIQEFKEVYKNINLLSEQYPYLFNHISSLNLQENDPNAKNGNCFDEENIPLYILISMAGEYFSDIPHQFFRFLSSKQYRNQKKKFREKY